MRTFSLLALIALVTFTAIGIGAFSIRTRPMVAVLCRIRRLYVATSFMGT